jgi:hypothetical protein
MSSARALKMSQSPDPAPVTNPAILSRKFNKLSISKSSLKSVVNKINGLMWVQITRNQHTHAPTEYSPTVRFEICNGRSALASRTLFMPQLSSCRSKVIDRASQKVDIVEKLDRHSTAKPKRRKQRVESGCGWVGSAWAVGTRAGIRRRCGLGC